MWERVELCVTRWSLRCRVSPAATTRWAAQALMKRAERPPRLSEIKKNRAAVQLARRGPAPAPAYAYDYLSRLK